MEQVTISNVKSRPNPPKSLQCFICEDYCQDAVQILCCNETFCDIHIKEEISKNFVCPNCNAGASLKELISNKKLRETILWYIGLFDNEADKQDSKSTKSSKLEDERDQVANGLRGNNYRMPPMFDYNVMNNMMIPMYDPNNAMMYNQNMINYAENRSKSRHKLRDERKSYSSDSRERRKRKEKEKHREKDSRKHRSKSRDSKERRRNRRKSRDRDKSRNRDRRDRSGSRERKRDRKKSRDRERRKDRR